MPYSSDKQRKYMYSQKPEVAKKYEKEGKAYVKKSDGSKSPSRKGSSSAGSPKAAPKKKGKK